MDIHKTLHKAHTPLPKYLCYDYDYSNVERDNRDFVEGKNLIVDDASTVRIFQNEEKILT